MHASHLSISIEEVNHTNEIIGYDIPILDSIAINIYEDDTLDEVEHEIIDLDVDFLNILSKYLMLTSTLKHSDSPESPSL